MYNSRILESKTESPNENNNIVLYGAVDVKKKEQEPDNFSGKCLVEIGTSQIRTCARFGAANKARPLRKRRVS